jgi:oligopeptide/dipeptide ABC transporter ATP-binding protein|nr:Peptide/nickel transport system ATP-binding protein/oligopeptide transport system ATP-binding [Aeromicrobium sp.]
MTTSKEPLLSLDRLSVRYPVGRRKTLTAVDGVSLSVREGETLGLIGESGSGKSTVARAIVGLAPVSGGTVRWEGKDVSSLGRRERRDFVESVQMIFQDPHSALDPRRTILQSVREPMDTMGRRKKSERRDVAVKALEDVGLSAQMLDRYPHQLSGGQKQRANIARALVTDPRVLICDESVAALDVALQAEILNLLQDLKDEYELTVIFISHDLSVVSHLADRISVMYLGRIVELGGTEDLMDHTLHPYSEALLSAQPLVDPASRGERIILRGDIPSPLSPPPGCRFNTRCPHAVASCRESDPQLLTITPGHSAACLRIDELHGLGVREVPT